MFNEFRLKMLNREASSPKNMALDIIKHLNIKNGMVVGDIGSGGGFSAMNFPERLVEKAEFMQLMLTKNHWNILELILKKRR
jgi:hypothetical protein